MRLIVAVEEMAASRLLPEEASSAHRNRSGAETG
jgi:hypothetical protein